MFPETFCVSADAELLREGFSSERLMEERTEGVHWAHSRIDMQHEGYWYDHNK